MKKQQKMQKARSSLKKDIDALEGDWESLLAKKNLPTDTKFLGKVADDIRKLNEDTVVMEGIEPEDPTIHLIQHMLRTPWGAPFVSERTLLEAALSFDEKDALNSDLSKMMGEFTEYSSLSHNQFLTILSALSRDLK